MFVSVSYVAAMMTDLNSENRSLLGDSLSVQDSAGLSTLW